MTDKLFCPRGSGPNSPFKPPMNGEMEWRGGVCTYCGSLDPAMLMARLEAGDVRLIPTDKNYKVYVENEGGAGMPSSSGKFYFQHLSPEQQTRFIELYNGRKIKMGHPGGFYVLPFFCKPARQGPAPAQHTPDDGA